MVGDGLAQLEEVFIVAVASYDKVLSSPFVGLALEVLFVLVCKIMDGGGIFGVKVCRGLEDGRRGRANASFLVFDRQGWKRPSIFYRVLLARTCDMKNSIET